ncbi:MAG: DUF2339 domain-containing protein [Formosimonas sp.]
MVFWGALWFSIFAGIMGMHDWFDGVLSVAIFPLAGALAGAHLRHALLKEWAAQAAALPKAPEVFGQVESVDVRPDFLTPVRNAQLAAERAAEFAAAKPEVALAAPVRVESNAYAEYIRPAEPVVVEPNLLERVFAAGKNWLLGGNTVVRVGVVLLFIGLAFLAKYTAQMGWFPIEARLTVVAVAGLALLSVGFWARQKINLLQYALTLQGAGVAVLYLTILAAMRVYGLLPMLLAFALMALICALGAILAYVQNGLVLALVSFAGGFAAPLLLSTGSGNYIGLFGYYSILNLAILGIAYFKAWRPLNLLGFFATFGVATFWGVLQFEADKYLPAQVFLAIFVLIYLLTAILYARNSQTLERSRGQALVDSTLVFGTPLVAFGLQMGLVADMAFGSAFSALGFALLYVLAAAYLLRSQAANFRVLIECFIALAVGFVTLAVPLALDGQAIGMTWALEGLGAFWVGMRQGRWTPRAFGVLLQGLALLALWLADPVQSLTPFANATFIGLLISAVCAVVLSYGLRHELPHSGTKWGAWYVAQEQRWATPFYALGFVLLLCAFGSQVNLSVMDGNTYETMWWIERAVLRIYALAAVYLGLTVASTLYGRRINAQVADAPMLGVLPVLWLTFVAVWLQGHALQGWGWLFWPAALLVHYALLYRAEHQSTTPSVLRHVTWLHYSHAATLWLLCVLLADAMWRVIVSNQLSATAWGSVAGLLTGVVVLLVVSLWSSHRVQQAWPLVPHRLAYLRTAAAPLAGLLLLSAVLCALMSSGQTAPLPYIPLLNPTDLTVAAALAVVALWYLRLSAWTTLPFARMQLWAVLAGAAFVLVNTIWLRIAHHFFGVDWRVDALFDSFIVQTGYAILWSVLALLLMVWAHRRQWRVLWMVGAGLLGLTVFKLIFIDLANRGGFERIVAFISVGVMMLLIGYLAPLPPAREEQA